MTMYAKLEKITNFYDKAVTCSLFLLFGDCYNDIMDTSDSYLERRFGGMSSHILAVKRYVEPHAYYKELYLC